MKNIILIGAGGHAKSCIEIISFLKNYKISYILDQKLGDSFCGYKKILYNKKNLIHVLKKTKHAFISFGQIKDQKSREKVFIELKDLGYKFPTLKAKSAYISKKTEILNGTIIMNKCIINTNSTIGYNNIINTGSIIEHEVSIGNHNHIAPGAIINGGVKIGNNCFIGSGSIIKQGIKIKSNSFIQAGKILLK